MYVYVLTLILKNFNLEKKENIYYETNNEDIGNEEEHFKITYFFVILDQAIKSLDKRFKQYWTLIFK